MKKSAVIFALGVAFGLALPFFVGVREARFQEAPVSSDDARFLSVRERDVYLNGKKLEEPIFVELRLREQSR
jgi:hypothetical protein